MKRLFKTFGITLAALIGITAIAGIGGVDRKLKPNLDLEGNSAIKRVKEIEVKQLTTGTTASVGYGNIYFKTNGLPYFKDSNGMETPLVASVGVGETQDCTMTIGATVTAPTKGGGTTVDKCTAARRGDKLHVKYDYRHTTAGTAGSGIYLFPIPFGLTVDTAKMPITGQYPQGKVGDLDVLIGTSYVKGFCYLYNSQNIACSYYSDAAGNTIFAVDATNTPLSNATVAFSFEYEVPISSFTSSGSPGAVLNEWQSYTPTFQGFGTPTNVNALYRRVGDSMELQVSFTAGTTTATEARVYLPFGTIDSTKFTQVQNLGDFWTSDGNGPSWDGKVRGVGGDGYITFSRNDQTSFAAMNANNLVSSGSQFSFRATVPISGWSGGFTSGGTTKHVVFGGATEATNCTSSPCTIHRSSGQVTSVTRTTTGQYTVNWQSGTWSQKPTCVGTMSGLVSGKIVSYDISASSSNASIIRVYDADGIDSDGGVSLLCTE